VRTEDKELEGPDLEREERLEEETSAHHAEEEEEELPVMGGEELRDLELDHRSRLFEALRLILAEEEVTVSLLYLPQRETHALEALQTAVSGHDSVGEFVFAEDRRSLLEQALAVLQQNVTYGEPEQIAELHGKFDELAGQLHDLRERLTSLEDAQEDMLEEKARAKEEAEDAGDKDDKGGEGDGGGEPVADGESTLTGPERPEAPRPPSTLSGPDLPAEPASPSTLSGPDLPAEPASPSTLSGPDLPAEPEQPSTLYGDAPPEGEAEGEAEAAKKPWWRRPFG
jgi:hypothetical protein